jgi:membrane protein required for colicin V production
MAEAMSHIGWIDATLLAVLAVSVVVGLVRGVVYEVMALAGWVVAWFGAQWLAPDVAPYVPIGTRGTGLNMAVTVVLCFLAVLIVWGLLARLVRLLVRATPLTVPDRLLGAGFGLLRGAVLLLALATVVTLTPAAQSPEWRQSVGAGWLQALMRGLQPLLPAEIARFVSPRGQRT